MLITSLEVCFDKLLLAFAWQILFRLMFSSISNKTPKAEKCVSLSTVLIHLHDDSIPKAVTLLTLQRVLFIKNDLD